MNRTWDKKLLTSVELDLIKRYDRVMDRLDETIMKRNRENVK
jgi:hypothetical protein